jgi:hypothetical protein
MGTRTNLKARIILYVLQPKATRTRDLSSSLSLSWERIRERFHITRQRSRLPHGHSPNAEHLVRIILALGLITPSWGRFIFSERNLSRSQDCAGLANGTNVVGDDTVIPKGGKKSGWLLYSGLQAQVGNLTTAQTPVVRVSFSDVQGTQYTFVYPPGFRLP